QPAARRPRVRGDRRAACAGVLARGGRRGRTCRRGPVRWRARAPAALRPRRALARGRRRGFAGRRRRDPVRPIVAGGGSARRAAPLAIDLVSLETDAPFFDRPFRLLGKTADGGELALAEGRLTRPARARRTTPVTVTSTPRRVSELVLEIEDGEDAPLAFRSV